MDKIKNSFFGRYINSILYHIITRIYVFQKATISTHFPYSSVGEISVLALREWGDDILFLSLN